MDQTNNFVTNIVNADSMRFIANEISRQIKRKLTSTEINDLFAFVRSSATKNWRNYSIMDIKKTLANNYLSLRFTEQGRTKATADIVDIHEILKGHIGTSTQEPDDEAVDNVDEDGNPVNLAAQVAGSDSDSDADAAASGGGASMPTSLDNVKTINSVLSVGNISSFMGKSDDSSLQQLVNPQAAYRKNYIILDSRYRDTSQDTPGEGITNFIWSFLANSSINTPGAVNSLGNVQQIVSIQSSNIRIPYVPNTLVNAYRRVTLLINEFSGQAYIAQENCKYHFMYSTSLDNNMLECHALPNEKAIFEFAKPITQLDSFTVSLGCPLEPIVFDMDRLIMSITYTNPAQLTSTIPHNLQTGDQVYMTTFTTNNTSADFAIIAAANSVTGYNVFVMDAYNIQLEGLDFTQVTAPINPYAIQIYFGSKRLFIPIEIKYIAQSVSAPT